MFYVLLCFKETQNKRLAMEEEKVSRFLIMSLAKINSKNTIKKKLRDPFGFLG